MKKLIAILAISLISSVALAKSIHLANTASSGWTIPWRLFDEQEYWEAGGPGTKEPIRIRLTVDDLTRPQTAAQPIKVDNCNGSGTFTVYPGDEVTCVISKDYKIKWYIAPGSKGQSSGKIIKE